MRTFSAKSLTKPVFIITFLILNLLDVFIMSHYVQNVSAVSNSSKNLGVTASVKDALSLALSSNTLSLDLTPTPNGIFKTDTFDATVSTSNQTGYTLYVASTGLDHNGEVTSNLIHSSPDVSSDSVISPLEGAVVVSRSGDTYTDTSAFASDRWGLSTDTTTFKPVSTTNTIFGGYESNIEGDTTNFTFGTKVDTNIVAGTYSNTLTVTAIANPVYRTFTINYDLDGGTSSDSSLIIDPDTGDYIQTESIADEYYPEITINNTTPAKTYHTFLGYATSEEEAESGTVTYQPGDKISMDYESPTVELYAVWQRYWVYTLTYDYNSGSGSISPNPATATSTTTTGSFTIPSSTPTRTGYTFLGWSETNTATSADYTANSTYTITTDTSHNEASATLYAVWKVNSYAVTIAKNGSGLTLGSTSVSPNYGSYATVTITPSSGYYISAASCNDSGYSVKTTSGTTPSFGTAASPTYTSATTFRIYNNSSTATGKTCTFTGAARTFTVTISLAGSGLSQNVASRTITYGSTTTVTITPTNGYYLSAKSCTNSYTTNGSTGTGATSAQTITISNNSKVANSTCTFTGAAFTAAQACAKITSTHGTSNAGNITMIKLKDGYCWTKTSAGSTYWGNAASKCPSGTSFANKDRWFALLIAYGGWNNNNVWGCIENASLYNATGWTHAWVGTMYNSELPYRLIQGSSAVANDAYCNNHTTYGRVVAGGMTTATSHYNNVMCYR